MALTAKYKDIEFGVGDVISIHQNIQEGGKVRTQIFDGIVIKIRGREEGKTFTVRKIGEGKIGIERIFPLALPSITEIVIKRKGTKGVRHAKLYYIRGKAKREIEKIYARASRKKQL